MSELPKAPVLDMEKLNQVAQDAAMQWALREIEDFYNGYNSPYRKKLKEYLEKQKIHWAFSLPKIMAVINDSLSAEITNIANRAIAQSFVPMVNEFFTGVEKEMNFSDFLKKWIDCVEVEPWEWYLCNLQVERDSKWGWVRIELSYKDKQYSFSFHEKDEYDRVKKESQDFVQKYQLLWLPYISASRHQEMKLEVEQKNWVDVQKSKLTMPFTPDVLQDKFIMFMAQCIMANTLFVLDTKEFDDDWFEEDNGDDND